MTRVKYGLVWVARVAWIAAVTGCSASPLGRERLMVVPESQMDAMGVQAFQQLKQQTPENQDPKMSAYVNSVASAITQAAQGQTGVQQWEVVVFKDATANAFALPGGKIGVHSGIFKVAKNDAQLATVLAHEVGHVIAKHGAERMSEQLVAQGGLALANAFTAGHTNATENQLIMGILGAGLQFGVILPFSRTQENEADLIGLDLMAQAGFNPEESIQLWQNMIQDSQGKAPPEFLSDHPASEKRIASLQERMPQAKAKYQQAVAAGKQPNLGTPPA